MNDPQNTTPPDCRFYLVIDLEATCCDQETIPREETEIIEIGAVMVDAATLKPADEFATFVRPVQHPQLTPFCMELTSIAQSHVDGAPTFADALTRLRQWAQRYPGYLFCSWGDYDRNQIQHECQRSGISYPFSSGHLNLKQQFTQQQGLSKRFGMAEALRKVGLPITGTHHRGIDDARNIARLLPYAVSNSKYRAPAHPTIDYPSILLAIQADERYQENLDWGKSRKGHPEGTVRSHIADLERNLHRLRRKVSDAEYDKLRILIHTHDAFKAEATRGVPIRDPRSHATLARAFLARFCTDNELLTIVQFHDEPFALWQRVSSGGTSDERRLQDLINTVNEWDLFLAFLIIDGCNEGKTREPLLWFFDQIQGMVDSRLSRDDILL